MMIQDLSILARAREQAIRREVGARQRKFRRNANRRNRIFRAIGRAICRMGSSLVSIGRRMECYELRLVGESEFATR